MNKAELNEILEKHLKWVKGDDGGERANLSHANLSGVDLSEADLTGAGLRWANLRNANLSRANLTNAYLTDANLRHADLTDANLYSADLTRADLQGADLTDADLTRADLTDANLTNVNLRNAILYRANLTGTGLEKEKNNGGKLYNVIEITKTASHFLCASSDMQKEVLEAIKRCIIELHKEFNIFTTYRIELRISQKIYYFIIATDKYLNWFVNTGLEINLSKEELLSNFLHIDNVIIEKDTKEIKSASLLLYDATTKQHMIKCGIIGL